MKSIIFTISKKNPELAVQSFPKLRSICSGPTHYNSPNTILRLSVSSTVAFLEILSAYCPGKRSKTIE
jgi:hypothetical protein